MTALAFDLICALRLEIHNNRRRLDDAKLLGYEVSRATWGDGSDESGGNRSDLHPLAASDRYADASTQVW